MYLYACDYSFTAEPNRHLALLKYNPGVFANKTQIEPLYLF